MSQHRPEILNSHLPDSDTVGSLAGGNGSPLHQQTHQLDENARYLTDTHIPGDFPSEKSPSDEQNADITLPPLSSIPSLISSWIRGAVPTTADLFERGVKQFVLWIFPPDSQLFLYEATLSHPIAATFVICQFICCGVPILVFLAGTFIFLALAILIWMILSFFILGPILLVASMVGVSVWGWGWVIYGFVKLTDKIFLGGMLTRLWFSHAEKYREDLNTSVDKTSADKGSRSKIPPPGSSKKQG